MIKILKYGIVGILILFSTYSCDEGEDGEGNPSTQIFSYFENNTNDFLALTFKFRDSEDYVYIEPKTTVVLSVRELAPPSGIIGGALKQEPFVYEELNIERDGLENRTFLFDNCLEPENPLCFDNYALISEETDEDGNKGIELKFTYN